MGKYIVFSDLHAHLFNDFAKPDEEYINTRLSNIVHALRDILKIAKEEGRTVLFAGDLFHARGSVRSEVFNAVFETVATFDEVPIIMIRGNHDSSNNSISSPSSIEPFEYLPNVKLITGMDKVINGEDTLTLVSYGEEYADIKEFIKTNPADILMAHLGIEGSKGAGASKLDGPFTVGDLYPENNQIVLLGHYHRSQKFTDNMLYVGNPVAQNFSDSDMHKGAYTFEIKDHKLKDLTFIDLGYPIFETKELSDIETALPTSYVRVKATRDALETIKENTEVPDNVRLDVEYKAVKDTRIDIDMGDSPVDISKAWAKEFMPEDEDTIVKQLNKVV